MLEIKITIEAPDLVNALNSLASAIAGNTPKENSLKHVRQAETIPVEQSVPVAQTTAVPVEQSAVQDVPDTKTEAQTPIMPVQAVPVAEPPQYTIEQIMQAGATLMDDGKVNELIKLLHSFNVQAVMDLKPDQLGAFATAMRDLGAKI